VGGRTTDQGGALATVARQPLGRVLVALLAAGLLGYALWRLAQALLDTRGEGADATGLATRAGYLGSAIVHGFLCALAVRLLIDSGSSAGSGPREERQATAGVLDWPGGRALVIAAALAIIGVGAYNAWRGITRSFMEDLRVGGDARRAVERLGAIGLVARGAVFALAGVFLMKAAIEFDPSEAVGLDGALARLADQPYGQVLLGVTAAGLLAYAAFCVADARWHDFSGRAGD